MAAAVPGTPTMPVPSTLIRATCWEWAVLGLNGSVQDERQQPDARRMLTGPSPLRGSGLPANLRGSNMAASLLSASARGGQGDNSRSEAQGRAAYPIDGGKALDADVGGARHQRLVIADDGAGGRLQGCGGGMVVEYTRWNAE